MKAKPVFDSEVCSVQSSPAFVVSHNSPPSPLQTVSQCVGVSTSVR